MRTIPHLLLIALLTSLLTAAAPQAAEANTPDMVIGETTTATASVSFRNPGAIWQHALTMTQPRSVLICDPCEAGQPATDLGPLEAGDRLQFSFTVVRNGSRTIYSSEDEAAVDVRAVPGGWQLLWEDGGGAPADLTLDIALGTTAPSACPALGQELRVTLPAVAVKPKVRKPVRIEYGELPLRFTSVRPDIGSYCQLVSNRGALPVSLRLLNAFGAPFGPAVRVASSVTTATLTFKEAAAPAGRCDLSLLRDLLRDLAFYDTQRALQQSNNCYLNRPARAGEKTVTWSIPGFEEYVHLRDGRAIRVYTTRPLTYHVNIADLALSATAVDQLLVDRVEDFVHVTLIKHLPTVDRIGIVQDPPARILVEDPTGRKVGWTGDSVVDFPGAGYIEHGDRSLAWILHPAAGGYKVTAVGAVGESYSIEFSIVDLLGGDLEPPAENAHAAGVIGPRGFATHQFTAAGRSLVPMPSIGPSAVAGKPGDNDVRRGSTMRFDASRSFIPLGLESAIWHFGDGTSATGLTVLHRYESPGTYVATLTIKDAAGNTATVDSPPVRVP